MNPLRGNIYVITSFKMLINVQLKAHIEIPTVILVSWVKFELKQLW